MNKIKCPLKDFLDQELPMSIIFDTLSIKEDVTKYVSKIIVYININNNTKSEKVISNIIKANIGKDNFKLLKELYIDTYNEEKKTLKRYLYFFNENDLYGIMDTFNIIYSLSPILNNVAFYYRKEKNNG